MSCIARKGKTPASMSDTATTAEEQGEGPERHNGEEDEKREEQE
jgi:hypothetical protein